MLPSKYEEYEDVLVGLIERRNVIEEGIARGLLNSVLQVSGMHTQNAHTHTHIHTHTYARTHAHKHVHVQILTHMNAHTHIHTHSQACTFSV